MSTVDSVFIIITGIAVSLFFIIGTLAIIYAWVVLSRIAKKTEAAIDSVEEVGHLITKAGKTGGVATLFYLLKQMVRFSKKNK